MRILFLEPCPKGFGGYYRAYNTASALAGQGHAVTVIFFGSREPRRWSTELPEPNLTLIELPTIGPPGLAKAIRAFIMMGVAAFWPRDVLHIFTSVHPENVAAILTCKIFFRQYILDWDDFWQDTGYFRHGSRTVRWYLRTAEEKGAQWATAVTVASDFLLDQARELKCRQVHKLPNGCPNGYAQAIPRDEARRVLQLPSEALVLFAFGNGFAHGRALLLLECVHHLSSLSPSLTVLTNVDPMVHLWGAAREGPHPPPPSELCARFRSVGHIPDRDIGLYLGASDFAAFLVCDVPAERSCSPIRITAYLGGECPIATTNVPTEARRLVATYGCGVIGRDPAEVAQRIAAAYHDRALWRNMKAGACQARESLNYEAIARELLAFYGRVLGAGRKA